jgi:hypothetical protein
MKLPDETRGLRLLVESGSAIVIGVERELPGWVQRQVARIADAWGRLDPAARGRATAEAVVAGEVAMLRVVGELRELLGTDPGDQATTPLQIVRTAYREPTAVLVAAGIPPVERDGFDVRTWPDDVYGLVPATFGDLGDPDLAPLHLAWGVAKAGVLRARRLRAAPDA